MGMAAGNGDDTHFMGTKFIRLAFLWKGNEWVQSLKVVP
jgi:hypothetical protein